MAVWKKIGCAVDGSPESLEALRSAAQLARQTGAELVLVHVESQGDASLAPSPDRQRDPAVQARLDQWIELATRLSGAPARLELGWGPAGPEIVAFVLRESIDLLVLGAKPNRGGTMAIGTLAQVIPHAPCALLLVREP